MKLVLKSIDVNLSLSEIFQDADEYSNQAFKASTDLGWKRKKLLKAELTIFGSPRSFEQWLRQPAYGLDKEIPVELLESSKGINRLWDLIWQIAHGNLA